jgi:hypothetical protein
MLFSNIYLLHICQLDDFPVCTGDTMSAVLQSPALCAPVNMENLTAYIDSEIEKGIEKALSSKNYVSIEDYNDTVELLASAMKRITQLENGLFCMILMENSLKMMRIILFSLTAER